MSDRLRALADELYAGPPDGFTAARDAAAKRAAAEGDKELAAGVRALRRPATAAWAVNLLVRREAGQIEQALELGEALREAAASMQGEDLRTLTRQRRQLTTALATTARALCREHGVRLSAAVADQVGDVLNAAMLDPSAAAVVRTGLLVKPFSSTGLSDLEVEAVLAVPAAVGSRATPVSAPAGPDEQRPALRVVPEDDRVRRARAQEALEEAEAAYERARAEADELSRAGDDLEARRLQLAGELDELRRRAAALEDDLDGVDDDLEENRSAREDAEEELAGATRERDAARRRLDQLGA